MIKKIKITQLRLGMFIHDLDIGWMDHPFLAKRFKLTSTKDMEKIFSLKLQEIYIDTQKGLDVDEGKNIVEVRNESQKRMEETIPYLGEIKKIPIKDEWPRAGKIKKEALQVVSRLMDDARLGRQVETERLEPVVEGMIQSIFNNQDALLGAMRIRKMDKYTFEHSVSVAALLTSFCKTMGMSHDIIRQAAIGGLLHDIGKSMVPSEILNKPGRLTEEEFSIMRRHVDYGHEILKNSSLSDISNGIIFEHHERYDGSGYPINKNSEEISRYGRMAAIVDVYDALTSHRCYHQGKSPHWVLGKLTEWSKYHFDPKLIQLFICCVGIYPVGTLTLLQSGRLAVVVELNEGDLLRPVVKVVYDKNRRRPLPTMRLDLANQSSEPFDKIIGSESPDDYRLQMDTLLAP
ncbi:HD-GYP domain-containing protein [Gammaproteobacteria bacterium]